MASLSVKYRPTTFEECCGQKSVIRILSRQVEGGNPANCYLFCGPSGTGKTTLARIFASRVNGGLGTPIEVDGASNNGVDNVRGIIESARERAVDAKYKCFVIDECHAITSAGWQAFLKSIEEPPKYTIFIFCTTDPQKIPATILNRVMRLNLSKVPTNSIRDRLRYICAQECFENYDEACDYIAKLAAGGVRDAISMLEKCSRYSTDLSIGNVLESLGNCSYESFFGLTNALLDHDDAKIVSTVEEYYAAGNDIRLFVDQYMNFALDLTKYCIFKSVAATKLPSSYEKELIYVTGADECDNTDYFRELTNKLLRIKNMLKGDPNAKTTLIVSLLNLGKL